MEWNLRECIVGNAITVAPIDLPGAKQYRDARSAAFYAMGSAVKASAPVTLVVLGDDLPSTYTAITEAWFQKANVIVIALFDKVSEVKTAWMDRCVLQTVTYGTDEQAAFREALNASLGLPGPVLINLTGHARCRSKIDYTSVISSLRSIKSDVKITAYCPRTSDAENVTAVPVQNKYGLLSKYIGMSVIEDIGVLLCPAQCALLDISIFRTRYTNSNMKIVLLDEQNRLDNLQVAHWISENGWDFLVSNRADSAGAKWLLSRQRQAVWMIR